ncbi:MAG TPA: electron transfer flavoprotein subunit beta/FixA family protein [Gemmatimonadales bacterium]|nr:electron transfer flavoprotein subunit beta/FixA family protein [Gemmatimonadales bacterium]
MPAVLRNSRFEDPVKIAVCIKRVPDTETRVKIAPDGKLLDEAGVKFILNPYDEFAVEEALRRREHGGAGEVVVIALGAPAAQETIRTALAMGADRGVLLQVDRVPADGLEVAKALAAELKDGGFDLILFGKMAIDDYNHQVGPMTAELLGLPCVTAVAHLEIEGGKGVAEREIEGGVEVVDFPLPAVLTTDKGLNEPRYPALKGIMAAKKKPLDVKPTTLRAGGLEILALLPPPERKEGKIVGEGVAAVPELIRLLREEAKVL